ncbi:hydroxymethylbilane synthase [soil metagenome]
MTSPGEPASVSLATPLRLATRRSAQASTQATIVAEALATATGRATELVYVETSGDRQQLVPLHSIGGQGVFVKEVQQAVLDGRADLAVHSAKDLPSETADGLTIGAFTARRDPADALVGSRLADLDRGATVASGSVRRRAQLAAVRPDLRFVELRGNISRRLEQVPDRGAIVMAVAALDILGLSDRVDERLDPLRFVPAVGQGCVAVECRDDDHDAFAALRAVDDGPTRLAVTVERAFLAELGSGCSLPVGAHVANGRLSVFMASIDVAAPAPVTFAEHIDLPDGHDAAVTAARQLAVTARHAVGW